MSATYRSARNHEQNLTSLLPWGADSRWGVESLITVIAALGAAGCASSLTSPSTPSVESTEIAPGVELRLSEQAGPEARRIAEEIQSRYASELITARPNEASRWPATRTP
jgi:hypothetical protein